MQGLRIKEIFTSNIDGISGPLFFSVYLKPDEMPYNNINKGFFLLKIPGFHVGGSGVTTGKKELGYILFISKNNISSEESIDKMRYRIYMQHVFFPFVEECRKEFSDWKPGMLIPDYLRAASWSDGDFAQIQLLTDMDVIRMYNDKKIFIN